MKDDPAVVEQQLCGSTGSFQVRAAFNTPPGVQVNPRFLLETPANQLGLRRNPPLCVRREPRPGFRGGEGLPGGPPCPTSLAREARRRGALLRRVQSSEMACCERALSFFPLQGGRPKRLRYAMTLGGSDIEVQLERNE